jgi:gluconolactonase
MIGLEAFFLEMLFFGLYLSMQSSNPKSAKTEAGIFLDKLLVLLYLQPITRFLSPSYHERRRRMVALKRMMVLMVVLMMGVGVFTSLAGAATTGILAPGAQWEEVSRIGLSSSEGVIADRNGMVYVSDLSRAPDSKGYFPCGTIWRYDPRTGITDKFMQPSGVSNGLHFDRNGDMIIAQSAGVFCAERRVIRRSMRTGAIKVVADSYQGKRLVAPNDVTSDAAGRIYFTDGRYTDKGPIDLPNAIYRVDPDGKITQLSTDIYRPNGIEVSPDGKRLYVAATNNPGLEKNPNGPEKDAFGITGGGVVMYDLDASGNISKGRVIYRDDTIYGDSMGMDTDGNLYFTMHNSNPVDPKGAIVVIDPEGRVIERITPPARSLPTNISFGRGTDSNSLYLTNLVEWRLWRIQTVRRGLYWD